MNVDGATIRLRGYYLLTSPYAYRVNTEISVDKGEYTNLGTMSYAKDANTKPRPIK